MRILSLEDGDGSSSRFQTFSSMILFSFFSFCLLPLVFWLSSFGPPFLCEQKLS